jgi:hypothetical protein
LAIVLSVLLSFGHCVVCSSVFWTLCCLFLYSSYNCYVFVLFLVTLTFLGTYFTTHC